MDTRIIKKLYVEEDWSLRRISSKFNTNHHKIKRILESMNIAIEKKPRQSMSDLHKKNISMACKGRKSWSKGKKMSKESLYKNMASHLRFNVDANWLSKFDDVEKLKFLNKCITDRAGRFAVDDDWYRRYIPKFYYDLQFNNIYKKWLGSNDKYLRLTIDHIVPKSKGGNNNIDNLQFLSWFENRAKNDMSQNEWDILKNRIGDYFV